MSEETKTELDYYREKAHILFENNYPSVDDKEITLVLGIISPSKSFAPSRQTTFEVKAFQEGKEIGEVRDVELKVGEDIHALCHILASVLLGLEKESEEE